VGTKVLAAGLAIVALAAIALAFPAYRHLRELPPPPAPAIRATFPAPRGAELGSGDDVLDAAISPDQRQVVFVATSDGTAALWRRALDSDRAERIAGTEGARLPAWKQTGNVISFFSGDHLKQVSLSDGAVRDLTTAREAYGAAWLPDGSLLYAADERDVIRRLHNGTMSDATKMRDGDGWHAFPMAAGDDGSFVYTASTKGGRVVRLVDANGERDLVTTSGHGQLVGDTLLYVRDSVLLAQRLAPETRQLTGRAVPIAIDVGLDWLGKHGSFTASPRVLITAPASDRKYQLTWFPLPGGENTPKRGPSDFWFPLTSGEFTPFHEPSDYWQVRLSPDDGFAALTQSTPLLRTLDVVILPMTPGFREQLTRAVALDSDPVWSPDGRVIAFRSLQDGQPRLYTHLAHFGGEDVIVPMSSTDETPTDWRSDRIIVHAPGPKGDLDLWSVNERTGARDVVANTPFNETDGRVSPDGRWLAYVSDESGESDIYATPWPRGARVRISFAGGTRPRWSRDGRSLLFLRGTQIMRADLSGSMFGTPRTAIDASSAAAVWLGSDHVLSRIRDFDVAHRHDGIVALIDFPSPVEPTASFTVDWPSLVK
jgi:Tol biopolymer transport system component